MKVTQLVHPQQTIILMKKTASAAKKTNNICKIKKVTEEDKNLSTDDFKEKFGIDKPIPGKFTDTLGKSFSTISSPNDATAPEGASCNPNLVNTCCSDPSTCLGDAVGGEGGGKALSTFQDVSNIVSKVGPGAAMALQGFGNDMSGMCEAIQGLAGTGGALSMAASLKCKGAISSCHSACDHKIQHKCLEYIEAKKSCELKPENKQTNENTFKKKGELIVKRITQLEKEKILCSAQKAKADKWLENMAEMANSALSAELCKQQSKANQNKKDCKDRGGEWKNGECEIPEEEQREVVSLGQNNDTIPQHSGGPISATAETPPSSNNEGGDGDTDGGNSQLGGGGDSKQTSSDGGSISSPYADTSLTDTESDSSPTGKQAKTSGGAYSGRGFLGGRSYGGYNRGKRGKFNPQEEDSDLSMGGGGFSGYGGGGSGGSDSYASLGLSKKKLAELAKKQGTKRKTAGEAGGAHQNIFERISKRFQSLCQNKLDCR